MTPFRSQSQLEVGLSHPLKIAITGDISRNFQETPFVNKILVLLLHLDDKPSYHSLTPDCLKHFSVHPS